VANLCSAILDCPDCTLQHLEPSGGTLWRGGFYDGSHRKPILDVPTDLIGAIDDPHPSGNGAAVDNASRPGRLSARNVDRWPDGAARARAVEREITRRISLVAVCCSSASVTCV